MSGKLYELAIKIAGSLDSRFTSSFKAANTAVKGLDNAQTRLTESKRAMDAVLAQTRATMSASQAYNRARDQVKNLAAQLKTTGNSNAELKASYTAAQAAVSKASNEYRKQSAILAELKAKTGNAGKSIAQMRQEQEALAAAAKKSAATERLSAMRQTVGDAKTGAGVRFAAGMGQLMAVKGLASAFAKPVTLGMEFQKTMSSVAAVSGASASELKSLTDQARELGATTVWSASQAAEGMTYLAMAGYRTEDIMSAMPGMLSLASAGEVDLGNAAQITSNMIAGFGLSAKDAGRVGDILTNTFTGSTTSLQGLGETMKYAAPIAKSLGVSLETTAAMAGKLGDAGIAGSAAGTALRSVMNSLAAPTTSGAKVLYALGVQTKNADGSFRDMTEILADVGHAMNKLPQTAQAAMRKDLFGQEAAAAAGILIEKSVNGSLQDFVKQVGEAGTAERIAQQRTNNLSGDLAGLNSALEEVYLKVSDALNGPLRAAAKWATEAIQTIGRFISAHKSLFSVLTAVVGVMGGIAAALAAFNMIVGGVGWVVLSAVGGFLKLVSVINTLRSVFTAVSVVMAANPIGLVITLVGALIAAGIALYQNWDTVKEKFSAVWASFADKFPAVASVITGALTAVIDNARAVFSQLQTFFGNILDFINNVFSGQWSAAWENLTAIAGTVFGALVSVVKQPINAVIALINKAFSAIGSVNISIPDWVPGMGGKSYGFSMPQIPQLAEGGIATSPTMALIGEGNEPEAVMPLSKLENMLGSLSTGNAGMIGEGNESVTINFNPTINIQGSGAAQSDLTSALRQSSIDLQRELSRYFNDRRRLSY